jgi:hypothetical protein
MRRVGSLSVFVREIEDRKRSLGITDEMIASARNTGECRTPEKREVIARMQERARDAGLEPMAAKF